MGATTRPRAVTWDKGIAARCPQNRTGPTPVDDGPGGAGWRWRPQPPRGPPTDRQPAGGHRPGARRSARGKPGQVETK